MLFYHEAREDNEVLILDKLFAFYLNKKLVFFQDNDSNILQNDIVEFGKNSFKIDSLNVVYELNYNKKLESKYNFIRAYKSFLFLVLILSLSLCSLIFFIDFHLKEDIQTNSIKEISNTFEDLKKESKFYYISTFFDNINTYFNKENLKLKSIQLSNQIIKIQASSKNKEKIYNFIEKYNSTIEDIVYDDKNRIYKVNAAFKIYRN